MRCALGDIKGTGHVLVKIGAADTAPGDLKLKLLRRRIRRVGDISDANVRPAIPDRSFHDERHSTRISRRLFLKSYENYKAILPPSAAMVAPVMKDALSEERNTMVWAISS